MLGMQGIDDMAARLREAGAVASVGASKNADFSAVASAAVQEDAADRGFAMTREHVTAVQAAWSFLTNTDHPEEVR